MLTKSKKWGLLPLSAIFILFALNSGCTSESRFPTEKRYWSDLDYYNVIREIRYMTPEGMEYPRFSNPETSVVIRKLIDPQNYEVVFDDKELGLNHRNEVSQKFFTEYLELAKVYSVMDRQDNFVYAQEFGEILNFGLGLQIKYFKLGNDRIIEQSDSPESSSVKDIIRSNEQTIIQNFNYYLDRVNEEKSFLSFSSLLADGINTHFYKLIEVFPNGNYESMLTKANLMLKKAQSEEVKSALSNLINKLEAMKAQPSL